MRISSTTFLESNLANISDATERLFDAQNVLSTGKSLNTPSDDPAGLSQALTLRTTLDDLTQYSRNVQDAKGFVGMTDTALSQATTQIRQARTLALQGATDSLNQDARANIAALIPSISKALGQIANSTYGSRHIFGGQRTAAAPFVEGSDGAFTYQGGSAATGDDALTVGIADGDSVVINVTGDKVFSKAFDVLNKLQNDLSNNQISKLSDEDVTSIDDLLNNIETIHAQVGSTAQRLSDTSQRLDQMQGDFSSVLSGIEDADIPKSILKLNSAQTAYQAALEAASRSFQTSLLDFLK